VDRIALFDLDNTLVDRQAVFRQWAEWFVEKRELESDDVEWLVTADLDGNAPRDELFATFRARRGLSDGLDTLVSDYLRDYPRFFEPDPEVIAALAHLRDDGWRIAIVTNGASTQHTKVARAGLLDLVDACCVSAELGSWKPDSEIFKQAVAACGADRRALSGIWMIGDSPEHDMVGAHRLGMRTVWMHRHRGWEMEDFQPDHRASSIPDAVDILRSAAPPAPADP
jgi:HAD superfamily hydrolase (TIGR01549 family)